MHQQRLQHRDSLVPGIEILRSRVPGPVRSWVPGPGPGPGPGAGPDRTGEFLCSSSVCSIEFFLWPRVPGVVRSGPGFRVRARTRDPGPGNGESLCCRRCCVEILWSRVPGPVRSRAPGPGSGPGPGTRDRTGPDRRISMQQQRLQHRDSPVPGIEILRSRVPGPVWSGPGSRVPGPGGTGPDRPRPRVPSPEPLLQSRVRSCPVPDRTGRPGAGF